jgi:hypothetical protein
MKKYLFSLSALFLALVFSAFSMPRTTELKNAAGTNLVWYLVDENNEIDPNYPLNEDNPMTAEEFRYYFYPLCHTGDDIDCARGFDASTLPSNPTESGSEQIKKDF